MHADNIDYQMHMESTLHYYEDYYMNIEQAIYGGSSLDSHLSPQPVYMEDANANS